MTCAACPAPQRADRGRARALRAFLRDDEHGSATIWNLTWLTGFAMLLGLGVDTTAAMNAKARLQTVADAASHAGVMDVFPISGDAVATAVDYAGRNRAEVGAVVSTDVTLGYWDRGQAAFVTENAPWLNAVRVVATRDAERGNALSTFLLKLAGLGHWDIAAVSTSTYFGDLSVVHKCRKNGLHAGGSLRLAANNAIVGEYCMHGETGFRITQNNLVTCGVELSTASPSNWLSQSIPTPSGEEVACDPSYGSLSNSEMIEQVFRYRSIPSRARLEYDTVKEMLDAFVAGSLDNDPFNAIAPYLEDVEPVSAAAFDSMALAGTLSPGTLYVVSCGGGGTLRPRGMLRNVGIYTDCDIQVGKDPSSSNVKPKKMRTKNADGTTTDMDADSETTLCDPDVSTCADVTWITEAGPEFLDCASAIAAGYERYSTYLDTAPGRTYRDGKTIDAEAEDCAVEPGANGVWDNVFVFSTAQEGGNPSTTTITFPNNMQLGRLDGCREGGGVRLYAAASLSTPAGTVVHGSQMVVLGDAQFAAKVHGAYGMTVEAAGDISFAAQGELGGCSPDEADLASDVVVTVRPIAIVN